MIKERVEERSMSNQSQRADRAARTNDLSSPFCLRQSDHQCHFFPAYTAVCEQTPHTHTHTRQTNSIPFHSHNLHKKLLGLCGSFRQDLRAEPRTERDTEADETGAAMALCGEDIKGARRGEKRALLTEPEKITDFKPHTEKRQIGPHQQKQYAKCHQPLRPKINHSQKRARGERVIQKQNCL